MARYPEGEGIGLFLLVSERHNPGWRRPRGRPQSSWVGQVDASCWELVGMGRGRARGLARGDCQSWRRRVGEATRPLTYALND